MVTHDDPPSQDIHPWKNKTKQKKNNSRLIKICIVSTVSNFLYHLSGKKWTAYLCTRRCQPLGSALRYVTLLRRGGGGGLKPTVQSAPVSCYNGIGKLTGLFKVLVAAWAQEDRNGLNPGGWQSNLNTSLQPNPSLHPHSCDAPVQSSAYRGNKAWILMWAYWAEPGWLP